MKKIISGIILLCLLFAFQITSAQTPDETIVTSTAGSKQESKPLNVTVTITGKHSSDIYDGKKHTVEGFDAVFSNGLYTTEDFDFTGNASASRIAVGKTDMGLKAEQFVNKNPGFNATFIVTDGYQEINAIDEVVVHIIGHNSISVFDGREHRVSGYEVDISNPLYKESFFDFLGTDEAKRTDIGISYMGLNENDFVNISGKFNKVTFKITDGYQEILQGSEAALSILISNELQHGDKGAPPDIEAQILQLAAIVRNDEGEEYESEPMSIDTRYLTQKQPLHFKLMFNTPLPDLTTGKYSVQIQGLPESVRGTETPKGYDAPIKNKYYLQDESWIDTAGTIQLKLLWIKELNYDSEVGVDALPEDSIGAYAINDDGEKEYVVFHTYEICMNYLGNDELCRSGGRTYNK